MNIFDELFLDELAERVAAKIAQKQQRNIIFREPVRRTYHVYDGCGCSSSPSMGGCGSSSPSYYSGGCGSSPSSRGGC